MLLLRRERAARSSPRSFTLTSRDRVPKSHAREQDVKYFDSADYSLQQVRAVCGLAGRAVKVEANVVHVHFCGLHRRRQI